MLVQHLFRSEFAGMGKRDNPTGDAASGKRHAKKVCACVGACVTCHHDLANPPPAAARTDTHGAGH